MLLKNFVYIFKVIVEILFLCIENVLEMNLKSLFDGEGSVGREGGKRDFVQLDERYNFDVEIFVYPLK